MIRSYKLVDVPAKHRPALYKMKNNNMSVFAALYIGAWKLRKISKYWKKISKSSLCVIAFESGMPVGCAMNWNKKIGCYVLPAWRERGIGTKLLKRLIAKLKEIGIDKTKAVPYTKKGTALYVSVDEDIDIIADD